MIYLYSSVRYDVKLAGVAELADAHDSKSCSFWSVGSTPTTGILKNPFLNRNGFLFLLKKRSLGSFYTYSAYWSRISSSTSSSSSVSSSSDWLKRTRTSCSPSLYISSNHPRSPLALRSTSKMISKPSSSKGK